MLDCIANREQVWRSIADDRPSNRWESRLGGNRSSGATGLRTGETLGIGIDKHISPDFETIFN
jgi:hypothetical protein